MLPRFPDETDSLPQFSLESTQERAPLRIADADKTLQQLAADEFELVDDASAPPSIMPVALEASDLEDDLDDGALLEPEDDIELPRRKLPWRPLAIGAAAVAALSVLFLASSSSGVGDKSTVAAALTALPKLTVELPAAIVAPPPAPPVVEPPPPPTTGTLVAPAWTKGRRVWVDGKPIAGHAPKLEAACGKHTVKVGAYGKTRKIDIVCGGETKITP